MRLTLLLATVTVLASVDSAKGESWRRHTIDDGSRGADGVRLGDINRDGLIDIVTGWEEGGRIRVCLQPTDPAARHQRWTTIEVGQVKSPEDAVFADVNNDGYLDVVSCCEGSQQDVFFHLHPGDMSRAGSSQAWQTQPLPGAANATRWMFCEPLPDGRLILGSKEPNAQISIVAPSKHDSGITRLRKCTWIMSLLAYDMDRDGNVDVLYSDRKGSTAQVGWLRCPGTGESTWTDHAIGGRGREVMFLDVLETNKQPPHDMTIACNTKDGGVLLLNPISEDRVEWKTTEVSIGSKRGTGKGVAWSDIDLDGHVDLVCTCEHAKGVIGVFWLQRSAVDTNWKFHDISGANEGVKFDRIEMVDIDGDGDSDVVTCEERDNLGVIWYENPHRNGQR